MNNERLQQIDQFLKRFRAIAEQNNNMLFSETNVYHELTRLGVSKSEPNYVMRQFFGNWIDRFKKDPNCDVFVSPNWQYFCQFISADKTARLSPEHLKVYIPLDSAHIERGANEIFDFLSQNGITHCSKIGSDARFDDIVVRLIDPEDVTKLINFVTRNSYIQEGLMQPNPFAYSINGIAVASDGHISYNSTIANIISTYINEKTKTGKLNTVGAQDFIQYVQQYAQRLFSSKEGLDELQRQFSDGELFGPKEFVNYKNVFELFLKTTEPTFNLFQYFDHFDKCNNPKLQRAKMAEVDNILNGKVQEQPEPVQKSGEDIDALLKETIEIMTAKYGDRQSVISTINSYIRTGNVTFITRDSNLRNRVANSSLREELQRSLDEQGINLFEYVENLTKSKDEVKVYVGKHEKKEQAPVDLSQTVVPTAIEIIEVLTEKFDRNQALGNLANFIQTGNYSMLTRRENLRGRIHDSTFLEDVRTYIREKNITLEDFIRYASEIAPQEQTYEEEVIVGKEYLDQAISETFDKYEELYLSGESTHSGLDFAICALLQLLKTGDYAGFTRNNNARANLRNNLSVEQIVNIIKSEMGLEQTEQMTPEQIYEYAQQYVENIIDNTHRKTM